MLTAQTSLCFGRVTDPPLQEAHRKTEAITSLPPCLCRGGTRLRRRKVETTPKKFHRSRSSTGEKIPDLTHLHQKHTGRASQFLYGHMTVSHDFKNITIGGIPILRPQKRYPHAPFAEPGPRRGKLGAIPSRKGGFFADPSIDGQMFPCYDIPTSKRSREEETICITLHCFGW